MSNELVQEWGNDSHRNCYNAMVSLMNEQCPGFKLEELELSISHWGADEYFKRYFKGKFPVEVEDVILMACRHVEYRNLTKV